MPGRVHRLIAVGIVAMAALGAPAGGAPAPAGGRSVSRSSRSRGAGTRRSSGSVSATASVSSGRSEDDAIVLPDLDVAGVATALLASLRFPKEQ